VIHHMGLQIIPVLGVYFPLREPPKTGWSSVGPREMGYDSRHPAATTILHFKETYPLVNQQKTIENCHL
jgi:hypothetical protein